MFGRFPACWLYGVEYVLDACFGRAYSFVKIVQLGVVPCCVFGQVLLCGVRFGAHIPMWGLFGFIRWSISTSVVVLWTSDITVVTSLVVFPPRTGSSYSCSAELRYDVCVPFVDAMPLFGFALLALVIAILALFGVYALMRSTITRFISRCRGILRATKIASTLSYSCLEKSSCR